MIGERSKAVQAAIIAVLLVVDPVFAAEPFKDFTFKLVKPPLKGATKLITIQVLPSDVLEKVEVAPAPVDQTGLSDWFWQDISPDRTAARLGRFADAIDQLAKKPADHVLDTPSLERLHQIAQSFGTDILRATIGKKISPALVLAMIAVQSSGRPGIVRTTGKQGLMQITPKTAARYNVSNIVDPAQNIGAGVSYLAAFLEVYDNDPILALAAYNSGAAAIASNGGVPPSADTRAFVPKVVAAFQIARALCLTPPELYSDGCVFSVKETN